MEKVAFITNIDKGIYKVHVNTPVLIYVTPDYSTWRIEVEFIGGKYDGFCMRVLEIYNRSTYHVFKKHVSEYLNIFLNIYLDKYHLPCINATIID